jgi:hypothetical protein
MVRGATPKEKIQKPELKARVAHRRESLSSKGQGSQVTRSHGGHREDNHTAPRAEHGDHGEGGRWRIRRKFTPIYTDQGEGLTPGYPSLHFFYIAR